MAKQMPDAAKKMLLMAALAKAQQGAGGAPAPQPGGSQALPPPGMKKGGKVPPWFEQSGKDKDPKGMKEGSKAEEALDAKQAKGMKCGGGVKKMAAGGFVGEANGVAQRGKTKGTWRGNGSI